MSDESFAGRNILLAEDQPVNAQIIQKMLERRSIHVDWAKNGDLVLKRFEESAFEAYDLIFMDIYMPGLTGLQATSRIRALNRPDAKTIPIIALTGDAGDQSTRTYLDSGFDDVLPKPVQPALLDALLYKWTPVALGTGRAQNCPAFAPSAPVEAQTPAFSCLDVAQGLSFTDQKIEDYLDAVREYAAQIFANADAMQKSWHAKDYATLTMQMHTLRSTAALIGAEEIAALAKELEIAGKSQNDVLMNKKTPILLGLYRRQQPVLTREIAAYYAKVTPHAGNEPLTMEHTHFVHEMAELVNLLEGQALEEAEKLVLSLLLWQTEPEDTALLNTLHELFYDYNYSAALQTARTYLAAHSA